MLFLVPDAAGQHSGAHHKQDVAHDGPGDRGLHHVLEPSAQGGERDDQLGGVAECGIEQPAHAFARPVGKLLGGAAHPPGKRQYRDRGRDED
jgi:hypothetical protein